MAAAQPRPVAAINAAIAAVSARRQLKINARDRRDRDMLEALRDVEHYENQIRAEDANLDDLLDERSQAIATEAQPA